MDFEDISDISDIEYESVKSVTLSLSSLDNSCSTLNGMTPVAPYRPILANEPLSMSKYWFNYQLQQNPYYEPYPMTRLYQQSRAICRAILEEPITRNHKIALLIRQFIIRFLPLTKLLLGCRPHMGPFASLGPPIPDVVVLTRLYVIPLYHCILTKIRQAIVDRKLLLSVAIEHLAVEKCAGQVDNAYYLFVILCIFDEQCKTIERRFVLYGQELLHQSADLLTDLYTNCIQLLWPNGDHIYQANRFIHKVIVDVAEFESLSLTHQVQQLKAQSFLESTSNFYCHRMLFQLEHDMRHSHQKVVDVIEAVRRKWNESKTFRRHFTSITFLEPPESFYNSARFYAQHFESIKRAVLSSRVFEACDPVYMAFSDERFRINVHHFAEQAGSRLEALELTLSTDPHLLSLVIGALVNEVITVNRLCLEKPKLSEMITQLYSIKVREQLDGFRGQAEISSNGDYQLVLDLIRRQLLYLDKEEELATSQVTMYHVMCQVASEDFILRQAHIKRPRNWVAPVTTRQMERIFPQVWSMFRQWTTPLPWQYLVECITVYSYSEADHCF